MSWFGSTIQQYDTACFLCLCFVWCIAAVFFVHVLFDLVLLCFLFLFCNVWFIILRTWEVMSILFLRGVTMLWRFVFRRGRGRGTLRGVSMLWRFVFRRDRGRGTVLRCCYLLHMLTPDWNLQRCLGGWHRKFCTGVPCNMLLFSTNRNRSAIRYCNLLLYSTNQTRSTCGHLLFCSPNRNRSNIQ